jgi:hypothetical protein
LIAVDVSLYLISRERIARLQKSVAFVALPRVGEFVKLRNREQGDYFAFSVVQVTHRDDGSPEILLRLTSSIDGQSVVSFIPDGELDEYLTGYEQEGWVRESCVPNRTFRDGDD